MDLQDFRTELIEEARVTAAADGGGTPAAFATLVADYLIDTQVLPDYTPVFYLGEGKRRAKLRVDGYSYDEADNTLFIIVVRYSGSPDTLQRLTRTEAERTFDSSTRFVHEALHQDLHRRIEISTPVSDLVDFLRHNVGRVRRYRFLLLTDYLMSDRIDSLDVQDIDGTPAEFHIWDIGRLYKVCVEAQRPEVEVFFTQYAEHGLPCLEASSGDNAPFRCFLSVIPGNVLADIYDTWGAQLLEGNVRSFLSTKVAVNKKIRETILTSPELFIAYNNGISATASSVEVSTTPNGKFITYAKDFQIINGGQTTASLSNARHRDRANLDRIMVQMKLTVIDDPETAENMVPQIARSSNSQNKVSDADFFSTHPFHVRMEQISRRVFAPAVGGAQYNTHWFYERARGQYLQAQMRMTPLERKRFALQNPKKQVITKTDLAKVLNSWLEKPHIVSRGAQTNFLDFAKWVDEQWTVSDESFNEQFFRDTVALFILFKHTERLVSQQPWYQQGYRANIVTYSIALLSHLIKRQYPGKTLDLSMIWNLQGVPDVLTETLTYLTRAVLEAITDPSRPNMNVTQWCKQEAAWNRVKELPVDLLPPVEGALRSSEEVRSERRYAKKEQRVIAGIGAQTEVVQRGSDYWIKLAQFLGSKGLVSPEERRALEVACQMPHKLPNAYQSKRLLGLARRAAAEGYVE